MILNIDNNSVKRVMQAQTPMSDQRQGFQQTGLLGLLGLYDDTMCYYDIFMLLQLHEVY